MEKYKFYPNLHSKYSFRYGAKVSTCTFAPIIVWSLACFFTLKKCVKYVNYI